MSLIPWYSWKCPLSFDIGKIDTQTLNKIRKKSSIVIKGTYRRKDSEEIDMVAFQRNYILHAVKGWKGMKYRHLFEVCELVDFDNDLNEAIPFSQENLEIIAKHHSTEFSDFIISASNAFGEVEATRRAKELKN